MDPAKLKQKLAASGVKATLQGEEITLRKIGAKDGLEARKLILSMQTNELGQPVDLVDVATFYAFVLSKSIVDADGSLPFDSEEYRAVLENLPLEELVPAAEQALKHSGMAVEPAQAKKNLTETTSSSPTSAEPSEPSTLTNCSDK